MPKFKNEYGVSKIKYTQKCRCFCPIGKADYTNNFTVTITPKKWIPDYCEIDEFIREQLDGKSLVIEDAVCKLKQWLTGEIHPCWVEVEPCDGNGIREGRKMRNTRALCQTAVVAALYVALTTLNPLSWGAIQFRVANMLCALPFKDKRYAPAVLLGIAIANATSPFGPVDVAFGLMAEGAAYLLVVWGPWKKLGILWKAVILSLSVALFIGAELYAMVGAPFLLTAAGLFVGTFLAVELGNIMISKTALARIV